MVIGVSGKIGSGKDTVGTMIQYLTACPFDWSVEEFINRHINTDLPPSVKTDWEIKKYADKLKEIVCLLIGCSREQLEDRNFKNSELNSVWDIFQIQFTYDDGYVDPERYGHCATYEEAVIFEKNERRALQWEKSLKTEIVRTKLTPRKMLQLLGTEAGRDIIHPNIWINSLFADYSPLSKPSVEDYERGVRAEYPSWVITDVRFPNEADEIKRRKGINIRINRPTEGELSTHPSETSLDDYEKWDYVIDNNGSIGQLLVKVKDILEKENII